MGEAHRQLRNEVYNHSGQGVRAFCQTQTCLRVSQSVVLSVSQPFVIQPGYHFQLGHTIKFNWDMSAQDHPPIDTCVSWCHGALRSCDVCSMEHLMTMDAELKCNDS